MSTKGHIENLRTHRSDRPTGFTLVEVLVAVAIVGMTFGLLMQAFTVGLKLLEQSEHMTVAATLADELHQMTLTLPLADPEQPEHWGLEDGESAPFDDVDDLDGQAFSPPLNADGAAISGLGDYAQHVTVASVSETDFSQVVADGASTVYRVTVLVTWRGGEVSRLSWLVFGSS